jgi:Spy/CpxP family protein refolding chaperone
MMPSVSRRLFLLVLALSVSGWASAQPIAWWKTEPAMKELGITPEQSSRIDAIFQESITQLRQQKDELDRLEDKLSHLIQTNADEAQVTKQIDRVETTRAALNKTRTLMLLHMRQLLTPDQRVKLNAMHDRWDKEQRDRDGHRQSPDGNRRPDGPHK